MKGPLGDWTDDCVEWRIYSRSDGSPFNLQRDQNGKLTLDAPVNRGDRPVFDGQEQWLREHVGGIDGTREVWVCAYQIEASAAREVERVLAKHFTLSRLKLEVKGASRVVETLSRRPADAVEENAQWYLRPQAGTSGFWVGLSRTPRDNRVSSRRVKPAWLTEAAGRDWNKLRVLVAYCDNGEHAVDAEKADAIRSVLCSVPEDIRTRFEVDWR